MKTGMKVYFMEDLYGTSMAGTVTAITTSAHCMDKGRILVTVSLENGKTVTEYSELFTLA